MSINIAIDCSPLSSGHRIRGVGMYTKYLIAAIKQVNDPEIVLSSFDTQIPNWQYQITHYPYFDLFFHTLRIKPKQKTIVTIHDVIPLLFPKAYPPGIRGKVKFILQKQTLQKVTHVITDSKTSKADIVKYLDYPQEKISVIYLAPANDRSTKTPKDEVIEKYHLPPRFILYVGDINYNKNVLGLISACKLINIPLVIVGKQAVSDDYDATHTENQPLVELIRRYGKDTDIIRLGFIEEANLKTIYQLAAVYCQPSFYEGFGLPVLEAMSHGCPVVAANTGSLPEICGGAAIMCKPTSTSIAEALHKTLQDENLRQNLIASGLVQVTNFSWEKTATQTINVYKSLILG